jgi:triacylglycerol lipase
MGSYPIVLAHGIARFDALWNPLLRLLPEFIARRFDGLNYFRNIKTHLESHGYVVYQASVPFAASLDVRAKSLAEQVQAIYLLSGRSRSVRRRVHIIGHSMGGLDARYAIAKLGLERAVSALSTIGTPHNGTSLADIGLTHGRDKIIDLTRRFISIDGLRDLATLQRRQFNRWAQRAEYTNNVSYHVYGACEAYERVFTPLKPSWSIINEHEGANDGLVSLTSQLWQTALHGPGPDKRIHQHRIPFPLDHFNECGWWDRNEPDKRRAFEQQVKDLYLQIAMEGAQ